MKVAYISSSAIPSSSANSIHVMKMCQAFGVNGHEVTLFAPDKKRESDPKVVNIYLYYNVKEIFNLIKASWFPVKGKGYIYGWVSSRKAIKFKPDLVFCRNLAGCFFSAMAGQVVVFESHAPVSYDGAISRWMFLRLIHSSSFKYLVVITHELADHYIKNYPELKGRVLVAPDAADPLPAQVMPSKKASNEGFNVGYVGQLYSGKGMEVVSQLARRCSWANFHVVGGEVNDLKYWAKTCEGITNITFHGFVPPAEVASFIYAFDVVLLPNQCSVKARGEKRDIGRWTSPLKAFEYMAAGKPIIASDLPVLREVLEDGVNSLLCSAGDLEAWENALKQLYDNEGKRHKLGEAAYKVFMENYTWRERANKIMQRFEAHMGSR
ncbi:glycosyltransferase family 4 protein [Halomonas sp. BC04]|uniref:glycosyltransferase family 4 protein n=1 Tax=Halomonas sp. BC04 TaxID=1403540 RepID=UPI0004AD6538|nr:glycosyltransferase family 4 protein [Halomonas sp. BC04]